MTKPAGAEKVRRHHLLARLLGERRLGTQTQVRQALLEAGLDVTQGTLSRDLHEMRVAKMPVGDGTYRYVPAADPDTGEVADITSIERLHAVAAVEVTAIDANENCVVLRTLTGRAQGVAVYLDRLRLPEVLGTIAGDDTILVLPTSARQTARLRRRLELLLVAGERPRRRANR